MSELTFNINNGYLEGLVRGFKGGILKQTDYLNLVQCETLEGISRLNSNTMTELFREDQIFLEFIKSLI